MKPLLVLHCAETIKGGIATYLRELLPLQVASWGKGTIGVIIPASQVNDLPVPDDVLVIAYNDSRGRVANAFSLARAVLIAAIEYKPNIVHVHSTFAGAAVRPLLALLARSCKVVYCPHGWAWDRPMSAAMRRIICAVERVAAFLCYRIICISEHEKRTALAAGLPSTKLVVVLNGVKKKAPSASDREFPWPEGDLRLLFVGRFDRQKGVDVFCDALRLLGTGAAGLLAGGAVLGDDNSCNLPSNARSVGWVNAGELEALFESADVLIVPSRWEGFGLIGAEAMRAGLTVIATRVGGLSEVVADGETGLLIKTDCAEAIVQGVQRLDRSALLRMGKAGRLRFDKLFTIDRVHRELSAVYGIDADPPRAEVSMN